MSTEDSKMEGSGDKQQTPSSLNDSTYQTVPSHPPGGDQSANNNHNNTPSNPKFSGKSSEVKNVIQVHDILILLKKKS